MEKLLKHVKKAKNHAIRPKEYEIAADLRNIERQIVADIAEGTETFIQTFNLTHGKK